MPSNADRALKLLLRGKRQFVSVYTPSKALPQIDFATGKQTTPYGISFCKGAPLTKKEVGSFVKEMIVSGNSETYLLLEKSPVQVDLSTRIVLFGLPYNVTKVFDSFYSTWNLLVLTRTSGVTLLQPEVQDIHASDRVKAYLDWLVTEVKAVFNGEIPDDLILWPIAGFDLATSLKQIYPVGATVLHTGEVEYKQLGRLSGYSGTGTVQGEPPEKATSYQQTNYESLYTLVDGFNTLMGRL